jgi:DNA invertase Pin-like site-specific DNA recombinase
VVAIGYIRVSTDGQVESGAGLQAQRATILTECERRGLPLLGLVEDAGLSAKTLDRPVLAGALAQLEAGEAAVLVVAKLDRLARSVADFANLVRVAERQGWALLACDLGMDMTTATGGLLANITASVAEWEGKIIGARTREALAVRKAAGVKLGRPRQVHPAIARRIQRERTAGSTLQAVADRLNAEGTTTPTGRPWSLPQGPDNKCPRTLTLRHTPTLFFWLAEEEPGARGRPAKGDAVEQAPSLRIIRRYLRLDQQAPAPLDGGQ